MTRRFALACALVTWAASAHAASTQYWTLRSAADHQATTLDGAVRGLPGRR